MSSYVNWKDIRAQHVARARGEEAVKSGKEELLNEVLGQRLAELRRARGLTQPVEHPSDSRVDLTQRGSRAPSRGPGRMLAAVNTKRDR